MQVVNVATLPGIVRASYAMPDVHWGYGFPIGGVAATDVDNDGVVSPGGVGFDISCGVRLLVGEGLDREELQPRLPAVMDRLDRAIPRGVGTAGVWRLPDRNTLQEVLTGGARFAVEQGHGVALDLERCEDGGVMTGADAAKISDRALQRGLGQIGSLGSGNHFLEVQAVDRVYDPVAAAPMGLAEGTVCVMIHTGSRELLELGIGDVHRCRSGDHVAFLYVGVRLQHGPEHVPLFFIPGRALRSAQQRRELINHLTVLGVGTRDWFAGRGKGRVVQVILDAEVNVQLDEHLVEKDMALFAIHRRLADFAAQSFKHGVVAL